jgi:hypothetical protein
MILGVIYRKFSDKATIYIIIAIFFLPGLIMALPNFAEDTEVRKAIVFNLLGPFALLCTAIYCYERKITKQQLYNVLISFAIPLFSMMVFMLLFTPKDLKFNEMGTESNYRTAGGYGPNQVSTILGLGSFVFFALFLFFAKNKYFKILCGFLTLFFAYRAILTFSRGGLITSVIMIISLLIATYQKLNLAGKLKIQLISFLLVIAAILVFSYTMTKTGGLITNRYSGRNAAGIEKADKLSGRGNLAIAEMEIFLLNPIFGAGIGRGKQAKAELLGHEAASHNEMTRMFAEQGLFGIIIFVFLFFIPLIHKIWNREQLFCIPFFVFWFLTINHAAIRIAAPAFIYGLSLLKVNYNDKT